MKKLFVVFTIILIILFVSIPIMAKADEDLGYIKLEKRYIKLYGEPSFKMTSYSKEPSFAYRMYQWGEVGIQVVLARDTEQSGHDKWFVFSVMGRCLKCGGYHIEMPVASVI